MKQKQTFESLRMTQDGKSNPFFWQGFLKDFRFVSPLDRQMNKLFEEASLSHGVMKNITYVLNGFFVIDFFWIGRMEESNLEFCCEDRVLHCMFFV